MEKFSQKLKPDLTEQIMQLIGSDIKGDASAKRGREGMDYWHILLLAGVRLGCNYTYDQVHVVSENHIKLRADPFVMPYTSFIAGTFIVRPKVRSIVTACQSSS